MKITKDDGLLVIHFGRDSFMHFENDWRQIFGRYNWKTYRFADIYYEDDVMLGGHEFRFVILGLGFSIRINDPDNPKMKELLDMAEAARGASEKKNGKSQA